MRNFLTSSIITEVGKIFGSRKYGWNDRCTELSVETLIEGFAIYLGRNKSKDTPVAVVLVDSNDRFHFGMYVAYIKDDESEEGSWTLSMTFNEKDIDSENWKVVKYPEDPVLVGIVNDVGYTMYGVHFKYMPKDGSGNIREGSPQELFCTMIDVITDYMRANVTTDPELELPNYFNAIAQLEGDGSVYIGIEPAALMKQHIKDDAVKD